MNFAHLAIAFAIVSAATTASAQSIPGYGTIEDYHPREIAMLPRYCIHTQIFNSKVPGGNDESEIKRWRSVFGPSFAAMHHYCWGLMSTNRALYLTQNKQLRDFYLQRSIQEFNYVLRESPPDFVLRPEILTKKGENLIRHGKGPAGAIELEQAIELKPDYWPPYLALSNYYRDIGDKEAAREIVKRGLKHAPDAKPLQRRHAELDGTERAPKK